MVLTDWVLKFLQLVDVCIGSTTPDRAIVLKVGLNNVVRSIQLAIHRKYLACLKKPIALETLVETDLICSFQSKYFFSDFCR